MKKRAISAVIMALIIVPLIYFGGLPFKIGIGVIAIGAFYELMRIKKHMKIPNLMWIIGLICMLSLIFIKTDEHSLVFGLSFEVLSLVFLLILGPTVFLRETGYKVDNAFYLAAITIFLGTIFNLLITLHSESIELFVLLIIISCTTDIFAYIAGKLIGHHTFTSISPNKTIEGCVVGSIVSTIVSTTYYATIVNNSNINIVSVVIIFLILTIVGQIGDLFFSLIKRENNVKDFSNLIPGHGGILDRIDSIIFILIALLSLKTFL